MKNLKKKAAVAAISSALAVSLVIPASASCGVRSGAYSASLCGNVIKIVSSSDKLRADISKLSDCVANGSCDKDAILDIIDSIRKNQCADRSDTCDSGSDSDREDKTECPDDSCDSEKPSDSGSESKDNTPQDPDDSKNDGRENPGTAKPDEPKADDTNNSESKDDAEISSVSEYEKRVVELVNEIRSSYGLGTLKLNEKLSSVAREKSNNMQQLKYFSHTSPTYGSPFDMMKSFGITYNTAGENIAMGYSTPETVVDAWMNSEGHRANILNSSYKEIGVGYIADGNYWTQMFIG